MQYTLMLPLRLRFLLHRQHVDCSADQRDALFSMYLFISLLYEVLTQFDTPDDEHWNARNM